MWRARHLDARLLAVSPALVVLLAPVGGSIVIAFLAIGIWLVVGRHRSIRNFDRRLALASFALAGYAFVRQLVDMDFNLVGQTGCRNYFVLLAALPFIPVGIVLVKNPVVVLSYGARFVLALLTPFSLYWLFSTNVRLGLFTNPLILTYLIALLACTARFPVRPEDRSGILWFYLAVVPLAATGGRIGMVFYGFAILIDLFKTPEVRKLSTKMRIAAIGAFGLILLSASMSSILVSRIDQSIGEIKTVLMGETGTQPARFIIWDAALSAFESNPVFGAGQCTAMTVLDEKLKGNGIESKFYHFHNMFADVLATLGLVGLALFFWFAFEVWRVTNWDQVRKSYQLPVFMLFAMIFIYGMTGSVISDDRMLAATFLVLGGIIREGKKPRKS